MTGHSRALERTGFFVDTINVVLDAGVDLPLNSGKNPAAIFVTHGHIDHMNALPMLLRQSHGDPKYPLWIFAPSEIMHRLRSFCQLSFSVKVDIEAPLPFDYAPPPEEERMPIPDGHEIRSVGRPVWRPVCAGLSLDVVVGKPWIPKKAIKVKVKTLRLFHGLCTSVGYLIAEQATTKKKLRPDLIGADKKETGQNVKAAIARKEDVNITEFVPERPRLAFVCDTTTKALETGTPTSAAILSCPTIMIECTYLEESKTNEAQKRGHTHWFGILPFVKSNLEKQQQEHTCWVLIHFSLRYRDQDILSFFGDEEKCGVRFRGNVGAREQGSGASASTQKDLDLVVPPLTGSDAPVTLREVPGVDAPHSTSSGCIQLPSKHPDVVLWLDSGVKELWIEEVIFDGIVCGACSSAELKS